ncbi:hypothetical protein BP6252_01729 [Coleophoma cylindrospora]|uniref:Myb-like domain-containing protein n=1 Tax=Coleophoma cylindrospora TaxID=1849047 RepID=A0A3D8STR6_9HELO|nr:hypothetical protein BP6252_01729 [Coleophoma cylindrospora]
MASNNNSRKAKISLTNYILGGPLVSMKPTGSKPKDEPEPGKEPHYSVKKLDGDRIQLTDKRGQTGDKQIFKTKPSSKATGVSEDGKVKVILRVKNRNAEIDIAAPGKTQKEESVKKEDVGKKETEEKKEEGNSTEKKDPENTTAKRVEEAPEPAAAEKEKEEEVKMPGQWKAGDWTPELDATIMKLKSKNKPWKDIAIEVGASKKDVLNRFKELQKAEEDKKKGKEGANANEASKLIAVPDSDGNAAPSEEKDKDCRADPEKKEKSKAQENDDNPGKSSPSGATTEESSTSQQDMAATSTITPRGEKGLRPDEIWTKDDCAVLEMLKERYETHKWQHMQAGFFNWTGRMVVASIIEKKFKDDEVAL